MSRSRTAIVLAWAVLVIATLALFLRAAPAMRPFWATAWWGLAVLASFVGYGSLIAYFVAPRRDVDLGLRAAWGFGAFLAIGGALEGARVLGPKTIAGTVCAGLVGLALMFPTSKRALRRRVAVLSGVRPAAWVLGVVIALLVLFYYGDSIVDDKFQPPDDYTAYFLHAKKLFANGTLIEPFSLRRIASYGGQTLLHAVMLETAPVRYLNVVDRGICLIGVVLLLVGHFRSDRRAPRTFGMVLVVFYVVLPDARLNSASLMSGAFAFLGLFRTLVFVRRFPAETTRNATLVALVGAAACTLRQNYLAFYAAVIGISYGALYYRTRSRRALTEAALVTVATFAFLAAWMGVAWKSNGTPLFPLFRGWIDPRFNAFGGKRLLDALGSLPTTAFAEPIRVFLLVFAAAGFIGDFEEAREMRRFVTAATLAWLVTTWTVANSAPKDAARYSAAFQVAGVLAVGMTIGSALGRPANAARRRYDEWVAIGVVAFAMMYTTGWWVGDPSINKFARIVGRYDTYVYYGKTEPLAEPAAQMPYDAMQLTVPPGAKMVVMVDEAYRFDFKRNRIASLDLPGASSPRGEMMQVETEAQALHLFKRWGYGYLALVRPDRAGDTYRRSTWLTNLWGHQPWQTRTGESDAWRTLAEVVVPWLDRISALGNKCPKRYDDGTFIVVDLTACQL